MQLFLYISICLLAQCPSSKAEGEQTYSLVTSAGKSGYCNHVKGSVEIDEVDDESTEGFPSSCLLKSVSSVESCESYCTSQSSCIGYTYHLGPNPEIATRLSDCHLFTSNSICPNGFEFFQRKYTIEKKEDLVVFPNQNPATKPNEWVCYVKDTEKAGLNEGQACGCDVTSGKCLGGCSKGLYCKYEEESTGHGTCTKSEMMVSYGNGFCDEGYYAGWDGKGINSQEECNDLCLDEPECTYASFFPIKDWTRDGHLNGNTCSRYNGQSCNLFCEKPGNICNQFVFNNSKTFKKTIETIA